MSTRSAAIAVAALAFLGCTGGRRAETPNLGRVVTPEEVAAWDVSIPPDGAGLPPGSGTPAQGAQGREHQRDNGSCFTRGRWRKSVWIGIQRPQQCAFQRLVLNEFGELAMGGSGRGVESGAVSIL